MAANRDVNDSHALELLQMKLGEPSVMILFDSNSEEHIQKKLLRRWWLSPIFYSINSRLR